MVYTDITKIPFNQALVEHFIPRFNGVFDILRRLGVRMLADVMNISKNRFLTAVGGSEKRWSKVEELQRILSARAQEVEQYFTYCVQCHEFPVLDQSQQDLSIDEKAGLAIEQIAGFLNEASIFGGNYAKAYMKVISFVIKDEDKEASMKRFSVSTGERVRQLRTEFFTSLCEGKIAGIDNVQVDDELILNISEIAEGLPMYASRTTLNDAFGCEIETSWVRHFLDYKEIYGEQDNNQYTYFDQPYYVPTQQHSEDIKRYISGVIASLGKKKDADVRPLSLEQVMEALEGNCSDYDYDQDVVESILVQHSWVDKMEVDGVVNYQLNYEFLNDYQKVARIIFEKGKITLDEIKDELERRGSNRAPAIIKSLRITTHKYNWVCLAGQNGVYEYNPTGLARKPMNEAIREYAQKNICFTWDEIYAHLEEMGYEKMVESSIRTYITQICRCSTSDGNYFCLDGHTDEYPHISWRSRNQNGLYNWMLPILVQYLKTKGGKSDRKTIREVLLARNNHDYKLKNDITTYLYPYAKDASAYFSIDGGLVSLTPRAWNLTQDEIEKLGLKNRTPEYYLASVSCIQALLQQAAGGEELMSVVRDKCREMVDTLSDHAFYKIVDKYLPEHISKVEINGKRYLKLDASKIEYAPSYEVDAASSVREESPVLVPSTVTREEHTPGNRNVYSWELIRKKMLSELEFYERHWDLDITMEEGVDKFIEFMQSQKSSSRLLMFVPQAIYEFWYCKNDMLDYYRYMMEIATSYEQVLSSICKHNGITVDGSGIKEISDSIPEMCSWLYYAPSDTFKKVYKKLKYTRNLLAHGMDVEDTLFMLVQKTIEFIALYVYTVARFVE